MKKNIFPALLALLLAGCSSVHRHTGITVEELTAHVEFLADQDLGGRYPGTDGDARAASYILDEFLTNGLIPAGENGYQTFEVMLYKKPGEGMFFRHNGNEAIAGKDFAPALFSSTDTLTAPVVFTGYGFDIREQGTRWNDYEGVDVSGSWTMFFRGIPGDGNPAGVYAAFGDDRDKVVMARDKGAAGVLIITEGEELPAEADFRQASAGIPVLYITPSLAGELTLLSGDSIDVLRNRIDKQMSPSSREIPVQLGAAAVVEEVKASTANVMAFLEGSHPARKNEVIVIGAHYDHLGMGGQGTGSRRPDTTAVHPGADDNASGVAALLELSGKLAAYRDSLDFSILFVAFGAEEMGLLGSRYLLEQSIPAGEKYTAMINLDMIGRLNEEQQLQIGGVGTAAESDSLLGLITAGRSFQTALTREGYGPSDHASFYSKDIPVFFLSTGPHLDYHTPFDTPDKINFQGLGEITEFVFDLIMQLNSHGAALSFRETGPRSQSHGHRRGGISFGIMPDYSGIEKNGLRADFVIEGRPASLAGMRDGDVITAINGKPVKNIDDYMFRLSQLKAGQTINVEIRRGDKMLVLLIQL